MTNSNKAAGDKAERDTQAFFRSHGFPRARRALGAGRRDDVGDMDNLPHLTLQVTRQKNLAAGIRKKLPAVETQRSNRRTRFGALFIRTYRRSEFDVVMTPEMFVRMYKYALIGVAHKRAEENGKLGFRDNRSRGKGKARSNLG